MGKTFFPGARKIWPLLKQPNYNGPWSTGCLLNPLNFPDGVPHPSFHLQADEQKLTDDSIKNTVMI